MAHLKLEPDVSDEELLADALLRGGELEDVRVLREVQAGDALLPGPGQSQYLQQPPAVLCALPQIAGL